MRARFNTYLDGDMADLIFSWLDHVPSRASARAVCRNWRALISGPVTWRFADIMHGLCDHFPIVEHFTAHWVFLPLPVTADDFKKMLIRICERDYVGALNWLAVRCRRTSGNHAYLPMQYVTPLILKNTSRIPRIYQWLLARARNSLQERVRVFWIALFVMKHVTFVSFLENASMVDMKHMTPWASIERDMIGHLVVTSDHVDYANRLANLKELAKPRWGIEPSFWSALFRDTIWKGLAGPSENCLLALHLVCEASGQVPPEFCEFLKTNGHRGTHQTLIKWCVCSNKKGKRESK